MVLTIRLPSSSKLSSYDSDRFEPSLVRFCCCRLLYVIRHPASLRPGVHVSQSQDDRTGPKRYHSIAMYKSPRVVLFGNHCSSNRVDLHLCSTDSSQPKPTSELAAVESRDPTTVEQPIISAVAIPIQSQRTDRNVSRPPSLLDPQTPSFAGFSPSQTTRLFWNQAIVTTRTDCRNEPAIWQAWSASFVEAFGDSDPLHTEYLEYLKHAPSALGPQRVVV